MANTEQILAGAVGAVVGFFIGGPAGAFAGFQYGLLAGALLFPVEQPGVQGPRIEDIERADAEPGSPVFKLFGKIAVPGFRMYLGRVFQGSTTEEVGGKGGGGQDVTTYSYTQTIVLGLCEGPIGGVSRIWENGSLKYDGRPQLPGEPSASYVARIQGSQAYADSFTLYLGTETQTADSTLSNELGAANVPGFRGLAYMVYPFRSISDDQGRRHPLWKIEVDKSVSTAFLVLNNDAGTSLNRAYISPPGAAGLEWEMKTFPSGNVQPTDAAYSPSLRRLCVVGQSNTFTSDDAGQTWQQNNDIANFAWLSVCWSPELAIFVAVADSGSANVAYSSDGINWTEIDPGTIGDLRVVRWDSSSGLFICARASNDTQAIMTSPDGINWTLRTTPMIAATNLWVALDGTIAATTRASAGMDSGIMSTDGINWSYFFQQPSGGTTSIIAGNDLWVSTSTTAILTAPALQNATNNWTQRYSDGSIRFEGLSYSPTAGLFIATSQAPSSSGNTILISEDGITWTEVETDFDLEFEVALPFDFVGDSIQSVPDVIASLCAEVGITNIDTTDLSADTIVGYAVTRQVTARGALDPIRVYSQFDYVESGETLVFRKRGGPPVATLTTNDLGAAIKEREDSGAKRSPSVTSRKIQDFELPRQVRLRYLSISKDYQKSEQLSPARIGTVGVKDVTLELALALDDTLAAQLAEVVFRDAWASRYQHEFSLDQSWAKLEVADPILIPVDGRNYRVRITAINDQALGVRKITAIRDDDGAYVSVAAAVSVSQEAQTIALLSATSYVILDLPALEETQNDANMLVAAWASDADGNWPGARLHRSPDGGETYSVLAAFSVQATVGEVVTAPIGQSFTWDNDATLVVDILNGRTLSSATDEAVLDGDNALAIGADGRWCIVQFADAELVSAGRYSLTRLLLGRRGTEQHISSITPGDRVVLLSGPGIYEIPLQTANINFDYVYRAVTETATFSSGSDTTFPGSGERLEPFSPVRIRGERDGSDNLTVTWLRRDRLSETLRDGETVPLSESAEAYEIDFTVGMTTVTKTGITSESYAYSAAAQTTDFGSPQASIEVAVYQISATGSVGRGAPGEATI